MYTYRLYRPLIRAERQCFVFHALLLFSFFCCLSCNIILYKEDRTGQEGSQYKLVIKFRLGQL